MKKYNIDFFYDKLFQGFEYSLPEITMNYIDRISKQVGSNDYKKTPIFMKKRKYVDQNNTSTPIQENTDTVPFNTNSPSSKDFDWTSIRNFHKTELNINKNGLNKFYNDFRTLLNKITETNFDNIALDIKQQLHILYESIEYTNHDIYKAGEIIFEIASTNKFYSNAYSRLWKQLIDEFDSMNTVFLKNKEHFKSLLQDFDSETSIYTMYETIGDLGENYDLLCEYNLKHEKYISFCHFFSCLCKVDLINIDEIMDIIHTNLTFMYKAMNRKNMKKQCESCIEYVYTLYEVFKQDPILKENEKHIENVKLLNAYKKYKVSEYPSFSSKIKFKCMDCLDLFS